MSNGGFFVVVCFVVMLVNVEFFFYDYFWSFISGVFVVLVI